MKSAKIILTCFIIFLSINGYSIDFNTILEKNPLITVDRSDDGKFKSVTVYSFIDAPIDLVWDTITDIKAYKEYMDRIERLEIIKDDKMLKELMKTIRFDFDLIGIKKIKSLLRDNNNLSEKQKKIELTNIFNDIFKDIITIKNKVEYTPNVGRQNKKIINLSTDKHKNSCNKLKIEHRQQCYWDNSNCKLLMTRDDYNYHLLRFTNEIYYNETKQSDLLDIKLDNINLA